MLIIFWEACESVEDSDLTQNGAVGGSHTSMFLRKQIPSEERDSPFAWTVHGPVTVFLPAKVLRLLGQGYAGLGGS